MPLPFRFDDEAGLAEKPLNVVEMTYTTNPAVRAR